MQKAYDNVCAATPDSRAEKDREQAEYAGFWVRLAAYIIDSILVFAGLLIVRLIFLSVSGMLEGTFLDGNILFHYTLKDIALYSGQVLYFILCTYYTGTTLGKRAMNLRVVGGEEERLTLLTVVYRETIGRFLSGVILGLGYLLIGIDKEKRGIHDILCDTRVVYAKRIKVYPIYQGTPVVPTTLAEEAQAEHEVPPVQQMPPAQQMPPVQQMPPAQQMPPVQEVHSMQQTPMVPVMPEGGYRLVKPQDTETEKKEQQKERDS